jgi:glycosyltransferase involved in cell wall biosynthesis
LTDCRILYLVGQLGPGGLERQLFYLLQAMNRERYKPAVAVWNYSEADIYVHQIRALGVPLYSFSEKLTAAGKLLAFRRMVRKLKPEVIHSYSFYTNFTAHLATWRTGAVALGSLKSDFMTEKKVSGPWLGRLSARWPHNQICNSFAAEKAARHSRTMFVPKQLSVVQNGVDLERFLCLPLPANGRVRIVALGSLLPVKRWDRLVVAAQELRQRKYDFLLQIAGDGPLRESLEDQVQELGLGDCIEFLGYQDDIPRLLSNAAFLVHTSGTEGCPNVIIEAAACGRAVVAMDAGDVPSIVEEGKTGFIVARGDINILIKRMATLITDRELCRKMGQAARVQAEQKFRLDRFVNETFAAYRAAGWSDT